MTRAEYNLRAQAVDKILTDAGFDVEWNLLFGMMMGRLAHRFGGWERVDVFMMEFIAILASHPDTQIIPTHKGQS